MLEGCGESGVLICGWGSVLWSSCVGNSWDVCLQPLPGPHAPKNPTQERAHERTQQPASGDNTVTHLQAGAGQEDRVSPLPWGGYLKITWGPSRRSQMVKPEVVVSATEVHTKNGYTSGTFLHKAIPMLDKRTPLP